MQFQPIQDRVLVRRDAVVHKSEGGILLPGEKDKPNTATVLAVGTGAVRNDGNLRPLAVQVGDRVVLTQFAGQSTVKFDGEMLSVVLESEILGVFEDEQPETKETT